MTSTQSSDVLAVSETLHLATDIVAAYVSNNSISADKINDLLKSTYATLNDLNAGETAAAIGKEPAVAISKSITPNHVICLEDGKKLKMLKRYLRTHYGMTPEEYRRKWGLPADYPMVAPNYAKRRSQFAKEIGLGKAAAVKRASAKKTTKKKSVKR